MEPIDYGGVLLRRWWVPVVLGVISAVLAVLAIPGASKPSTAKASSWKWTTYSLVGAPPQAAKSLEGLGSALTTDQILFYSHETSVVEAAAKAVGFTQPVHQLVAYAVGPAPKKAKTAVAGLGVGEVALSTNGPTPAKSAAFTNAYAKALGNYINGLVSSKQQAQLQQVQSTINKLKFEVALAGSKAPASLTSQLSSAQTEEQTLTATPVTTGYQVLSRATASGATNAGGGKVAGATSSKKVRLLGGFVVGLIIGAGIVLNWRCSISDCAIPPELPTISDSRLWRKFHSPQR